MQLAEGNETKACDLSAAPAGLEVVEWLFGPVIRCVARGTCDASVDVRDGVLANTPKQSSA